MINKLLFKRIWDAINGKNPVNDTELLIWLVCNSIEGNLKSVNFVIPNDLLELYTDNPLYEDALLKCRGLLKDQLMTSGGEVGKFAERLDENGGIQVKIGAPCDDLKATKITNDRLPSDCNIWYVLSRTSSTPMKLIIKGNGIYVSPIDPDKRPSNVIQSITLDPNKRYIIGRQEESKDNTTMITFPDKDQRISREQIRLYCDHNKWFCEQLSKNCATFIQRKKSNNLLSKNEPVALVDNGNQYDNKIEFYNGKVMTLYYYFQ